MKIFLKKTGLFILAAFSICGFNFLVNHFTIKKIPELNCTNLFVGDSRVMTAINPALINASANIAQNSESYLITYFKLKHLLNGNSTVKRVLLGFSYPNFSGYMDSLYYQDMATADIFARVYPILKPHNLYPLKVDVLKFYSIYFKNTLLYPKINHFSYVGEFVKLKYGLNKADLEGVIKRHYFYRSGRPAHISNINNMYLDSIINLVQNKGLEIVLINIPLQPKYMKRVPKRFVEFYNGKRLELQASGIKVLDYSDLVLEDKYFKDYNHLDLEGANFFTQILKKDLNL